MTATTRIVWTDPQGETTVFGAEGIPLLDADRFSHSSATPILRGSPGQRGSTFTDHQVSHRNVSVQISVRGLTTADFYGRMAALTASMAVEPSTGQSPKLGTLRVERPGQVPVETLAVPVQSPQVASSTGPVSAIVDIEWLCPSPLWWETSDRALTMNLAPDDPWVSPWVSPWTVSPVQSVAELDNPGVPVGFKVRFWGPQVGPRLVNVQSGEQLSVSGSVPAGGFVEVDTELRTVTADGVQIWDRWDFESGSWWQLGRGFQTVRAEANEAGSDARTVMIWRPAFGGI